MAKIRIVEDDTYNKVKFDILQVGEVFVYEGCYYLKNSLTTAMDLIRVATCKFEPEMLVTYVDKAELYLSY